MFRRKKQQLDVPVQWLIVGLGNPGAQYDGTRHNVGFDLIDKLATQWKIKLSERRFHAVFGEGEHCGVGVVIAKPVTYMNASGIAVKQLLRHYNLTAKQVVVIADELDLAVGRARMKPHGGSGGHNGHRSIQDSLGSNEYPRIRIGIGKAEESGVDHVLTKFKPDERVDINAALAVCESGLDVLLSSGLERAITYVNENSNK